MRNSKIYAEDGGSLKDSKNVLSKKNDLNELSWLYGDSNKFKNIEKNLFKDLEISDFPDNYDTSDETKQENYKNNDDDDESDGEEVTLGDHVVEKSIPQVENIQKAIVEEDNTINNEIADQLINLKQQLLIFKEKYHHIHDTIAEIEFKNVNLTRNIISLEEDNNALQKALELQNDKNQNILKSNLTRVYNNTNNKRQNQQNNIENNKLLSHQNDIRRALLNATDNTEFNNAGFMSEMLHGEGAFDFIYRYLHYITPLSNVINEMESKFGSSVASYFVFYRWIFMNFVIINALTILFTILHLITLFQNTNNYTNMFSSGGYLPTFMIITSYSSSERVPYSFHLVIILLFILSTCIEKYIREDRVRRHLDAMESIDEQPLAKEVFCCWDNSVLDSKTFCGSLSQNFSQKVIEITTKGKMKARSQKEQFIIYIRRIIGTILYTILQFSASALILYVTVQSPTIKTYFLNLNSSLSELSSLIVPIVVVIINTLTPKLIEFITNFEKWDSGDINLNIMLFRLYFSNTLNLLLVAATYCFLADPFFWTSDEYMNYRISVEILFRADIYTCRLGQTANGIFTLVMTTFFISIIIFFGNGYKPVLERWIFNIEVEDKEFKIASSMVNVLYFSGINLLLFPFAPLSIILTPIMFIIKIYIEKFLLLKYYSKPKKPWKAQKAGSVFNTFFMCTVFFVAIPAILFVLAGTTFAKNCLYQDDSVDLCISSLSNKNTCTLNSNSIYYTYFNDPKLCPVGYPACVCSGTLACGPFVDDNNGFYAMKEEFMSLYVLDYIWYFFFENSYGGWILIIILILIMEVRKNIMITQNLLNEEHEKNMSIRINNLENEKLKHEAIIRKLKAVADG